MVIDNGFEHESKIMSKNLDCPTLSGFNHIAIYLRWAYEKGLVSGTLLKTEPRIKETIEGDGDLRQVIAESKVMKGRIRSADFTTEGEKFTKFFYAFGGRDKYPYYVDKVAESYFGAGTNSEQFKNEKYLFVPYDEDYYNNLCKYIDEAWEKRDTIDDDKAAKKENLIKWLNSVAKTEIRVSYTHADSSTALTASRIGGRPAVPEGFVWPYFEGVGFGDSNPKNRPLSFMAQINLKDIIPMDKEGLLPDTGILAFFYEMNTQTWGFDPKDNGSAKVYYFPDETDLHLEEIPDDMEDDFRFPEFALSFEEKISLPDMSEFRSDLSLDWEDNIDCVTKAGYDLDEWGEHTKLLGYPDTIQNPMYEECEAVTRGWRRGCTEDFAKIPKEERADIKEKSSEWMLLFQMGTVETDDFEMMFGDCGHIYFWIRKSDLAARDFNKVWLILQCS